RSSTGLQPVLGAATTGPISVAGKPGMPRKRGTCPPNLIKCLYTEPPLCLNDSDCRGRQKCCYNMCRFRCVDPEEGTRDGGYWGNPPPGSPGEGKRWHPRLRPAPNKSPQIASLPIQHRAHSTV
uniref:WAP domain-containing protein n=1 Tax=Chrysemys picta bellii TaxID=8478 RepID=A0A8C3IW05_CHRPI